MERQEQEYEYSSHPLNYSYQEFLDKGKTLQNCIIDKYVIYDKIGEGSFGCVYRGMDDQSKKQVAVKVIDMREIHNEKSQKMKQIKMRLADTEPRLMQMCNSPNLLKCYDVYQNDDLKILMIEYCNGKTLQQEIDQKKSLPQNQAATILRHIINGLIELHKHKIVHRDLKADNIMSHNGTYKIIDFGFSKKLDIAQQMMEVKGTSLGTITTMAPEVMSRMPYGLKADIWSTGIIFFQMIYGIYPYDSQTAQQMYREIRKSTVFANPTPMKINGITPSQQAYDFLKFMIVFNTSQRPDWKSVSEHPLIKNINDSSINQRFLKQCQVVVDQKLNCDQQINQDMPIRSTLKRKNLNEEQRESLRRPQPQNLDYTKQIIRPNRQEQKPIFKPFEKIEEKVLQKPIQKIEKKMQQKQPIKKQQSKKEQVINFPKKQISFPKQKTQQMIKGQESIIRKKKIADLMKREEEQQEEKKKAKQRQLQKIHQQKKKQDALMVEELSRKIQQRKQKQFQYGTSFKQESYLKKQVRPIQIQKGLIAEKKKEINEEQAEQFAWTEKAHLQCLKTQLIFREIINPIEMGKLINVDSRKGVQFFYLLIARCLNNMSPVQYEQETRKKNKHIIDNLYIQIDAIYRQVSKKFEQFSTKLTSVEDKTIQKIFDFFKKKIDQNTFQTKDNFLTGLENYQYTKSQQIQYTFDYYKKYIESEMIKHPNAYLVCQRMDKYIQINSITMEMINKKKKDFYKIVQQILTKK